MTRDQNVTHICALVVRTGIRRKSLFFARDYDCKIATEERGSWLLLRMLSLHNTLTTAEIIAPSSD